jgi:2-aminoadipate transaminase
MEHLLLSRCAARLSPTLPVGHVDDSIIFGSGDAFPGLFPDLTAAAQTALDTFRPETLQYGPRPGHRELREWIAGYMGQDGVTVSPDEIIVVNGAKHGLELACRMLLDEGDPIIVTAPTYFTAIPMFKSFGVQFLEAPQDDEGLDVDQLAGLLDQHRREGGRPPKFLYNVPDYHNPTGVSMSRRRREALLNLAASQRIPIVEDSPYRKVRFEGELVPSLKGLDRSHTVITLGTFAKLIAPGLRIGWVAAERDIIARMAQLKADGGSSPMTQRIILEFVKGGGLPAHIERVQSTYRVHRDCMLAALRRWLPEASARVPKGGYYLWLQFPAAIDTEELTTRAAHEGVIVIPGSKFFAGKAAPKNFLRLAYSYHAPKEIEEGVQRLARAFKSMQ